jgi:hypothetical protein
MKTWRGEDKYENFIGSENLGRDKEKRAVV